MTNETIRQTIDALCDLAGGDAGLPGEWLPVVNAMLSDSVISAIRLELAITALHESTQNTRQLLALAMTVLHSNR